MSATTKERQRVIAAIAGALAGNATVTRETFARRFLEVQSEHAWIAAAIDRNGWDGMRLAIDVERRYRELRGMPTGSLWMHRREYSK